MNRIFSKTALKYARKGFKYGKTFAKKTFSEKHLLKTNLAISLVLSVTADGLVQRAARPHEKLDKPRLARMGGIGIEFGLITHFWYQYLDRMFVGVSWQAVTKKVLVDQVMMTPIYILIFFASLAVMEGNSPIVATSELTSKGPTLYVVDWLIWPPAQFINFRFLPLHFRVLFDGILSFLVDVIYSYVRFETE